MADCYLYDYICEGNNKFELDCKILKNDSNIEKYNGKYTIHIVEYYSKYFPENLTTEDIIKSLTSKNRNLTQDLHSIIFILIATIIFILVIKDNRGKIKNKLKEVNIIDNTYIPVTIKINK